MACQKARPGSPSARLSNDPRGSSDPLAGSAQTRPMLEGGGEPPLDRPDEGRAGRAAGPVEVSKGEPLAEFEAEPQPCLPECPHTTSVGEPQSLDRTPPNPL